MYETTWYHLEDNEETLAKEIRNWYASKVNMSEVV
jgi:hypothetical protein